MMRVVWGMVVAAWVSAGVAAEPASGDVGWTSQPPSAGVFVKVGQRYMVPYTETIPGTDVEFEMIPVPGGTYQMGSPPGEAKRKADEGPQIQVRVDPMWVGKHEVTQAEYCEFEQLFYIILEIESDRDRDNPFAADAVTAPTALYDGGHVYEWGESRDDPAVCMTQFAAQQYTKWISALTKRQYRLPCEAEWEFACRGGSTAAYSWGDDVQAINDYAWFFANADEGYSRVGRKKPSPFGLYDMHGNVGEWTVNAYTKDGYAWLKDRRQVQAMDTVKWPQTASSCVVRGGSFDFDAERLRSAARLESRDDDWKQEDPHFPQSPYWFTSDPARGVGFRLFRSWQDLDPPSIGKFWNHMAPDLREAIQQSVQHGRGHVLILDERLLPATKAYKIKQAKWQEQRRRTQQRIRNARPAVEE